MVRPMMWRVLALALVAAGAVPVHATDVYQVSTISSLLAGGYDGETTVGELLGHGGFGLGTFNGVDGESTGRSTAALWTGVRMWSAPRS
jgi:hypothetical protein